jgi:dolichol-phosphate mannosyltransferase
MTADLAIVIPTYNERDNVAPLHAALVRALNGVRWEAVFVDDDSPDGTAQAVRALARTDGRVRCLQRLGRRGLASACIEGTLATSAPCVCVIDADLQHDEAVIPRMLEQLVAEGLDLVVATRYAGRGGLGTLSPLRVRLSRLATRLTHALTRVPVSDPMSGFFLFRRAWFERIMRRLSGRGFKILLDMLLSADAPPRFGEIGYTMRARTHGESKLSAGVIWDFGLLLAHKLLGRMIPPRFISFSAVGLSGVAVHMGVLWLVHRSLQYAFVPAQAAATVVAMTSNFALNNALTYSDRRLHGLRALRGLISFYAACALGALINVALAGWSAEAGAPWWAAGLLGVVAGAVWNFASTAVLTWRDTGP